MNRSTSNSSKSHQILDPYGIYGTRTAHRMRNRQRRRRTQQFMLVLILIGLLALAIFSWRNHQTPTLTGSNSWALHLSPSAAPVWDDTYNVLLVPTRDGRLLAVWPMSQPARSKVWLKTDFPLRSKPVLGKKYFYVGSENGTLYALERGSGELAWQYHSGAPISTRPQLLGNLIFCGNDHGWVSALRAKSGELVWRRKLHSPIGNGMATTAEPRKMLLVPLVGDVARHGGVWAMDVNNGNVLWKFPTDSSVNAQQMTPPVMASLNHQMRVFCANDTGALLNLNAANGKYGDADGGWKIYLKHLQKRQSQLLLRQPPLIVVEGRRQRLYINGNDDAVRCLDARDGRLLWKWQAPASSTSPLQWCAGLLLVPVQGSASYLLNPQTGIVEAQLHSMKDPFVAMTVADDVIWALGAKGTLQRFEVSKIQ